MKYNGVQKFLKNFLNFLNFFEDCLGSRLALCLTKPLQVIHKEVYIPYMVHKGAEDEA